MESVFKLFNCVLVYQISLAICLLLAVLIINALKATLIMQKLSSLPSIFCVLFKGVMIALWKVRITLWCNLIDISTKVNSITTLQCVCFR